MEPGEITKQVSFWISMTLILQNIGGFLGIWAYSRVTPHIGRKPAFAIAFVLAMLSTAMVFGYMNDRSEIFWMIPIMGFCQLALFGGYAIYFPGIVSHAVAQHRHVVLLQRGPLRGRRRTLHLRLSHQQRLRPS